MSLPLAGKVAIVTGATKGIGRSIALQLLSQGARVAVTYGRDKSAAEALSASLPSEQRSNFVAIQADASSLDSISGLISTVTSKFGGKIDILIPNAGILPLLPSISNITSDAFDRAYNMNVKGPLFLAQQAIPHMPAGGRILFLSTTQNFASTVTAPYLLYCSTKGAIDQITRVLAKEVAAKGISVNAIAPGPTGTDLFFESNSEALLKQIASLNPFGRIGEPDEVAAAAVFLCGEGARWINGQIVKVNGGHYVG